MIQHGAPGDGKSISMWLHFQVLAYFDKTRNKVAWSLYKQKKDQPQHNAGGAHAADRSDEVVAQPPELDSVFSKGTFTGMGQFLKGQKWCGLLRAARREIIHQ